MQQQDTQGMGVRNASTSSRQASKWEERSIIEAIRARGYEPDEILVRDEQRT